MFSRIEGNTRLERNPVVEDIVISGNGEVTSEVCKESELFDMSYGVTHVRIQCKLKVGILSFVFVIAEFCTRSDCPRCAAEIVANFWNYSDPHVRLISETIR